MTFCSSNDPLFSGKGGALIATKAGRVYNAKYFPAAQGLTKDSFKFTEVKRFPLSETTELGSSNSRVTSRQKDTEKLSEHTPPSPSKNSVPEKQSQSRAETASTLSHSLKRDSSLSPKHSPKIPVKQDSLPDSPAFETNERDRSESIQELHLASALINRLSNTADDAISSSSSTPFSLSARSTFTTDPQSSATSKNTSAQITPASTFLIHSTSSDTSAVPAKTIPFQFQGPATTSVPSSTFDFTAKYQPPSRVLFNRPPSPGTGLIAQSSESKVETASTATTDKEVPPPLSNKQKKRLEARTALHEAIKHSDNIYNAVDEDGERLNQFEKPPRGIKPGPVANFQGPNFIPYWAALGVTAVDRKGFEEAQATLQKAITGARQRRVSIGSLQQAEESQQNLKSLRQVPDWVDTSEHFANLQNS